MPPRPMAAPAFTAECLPMHNGKHSCRVSPSIVHTIAPEDQCRRSNFFLRIFSFLLVETCFMVLAYRCLIRPIPIRVGSSESSLAEAKAATTAISVIWHTFGAFLVKDVVSRVFSAECMAQFHRSGHLEPGKADRVSTITSGQITQAKHFFSRAATVQYRLAICTMVLIMILGPLGPSVITANTTLFDSRLEIQLASMPLVRENPSPGSNQSLAIDRAGIISRLEWLENNTYGFQSPQEGVLIPWPRLNQNLGDTSLIYESDIIMHSTSCEWKDVTPTNRSLGGAIPSQALLVPFRKEDDMLEWRTRSGRVLPTLAGLSLYQSVVTQLMQSEDSLSVDSSRGALFAFLFVGNNSLLQPDPNAIVLDGLPTFSLSKVLLGDDPLGARFPSNLNGSVLLCDPRSEIVRGEVTLSQNKLDAKPLVGAPLVGNIPANASRVLFSQSLLDATAPTPDAPINPISLLLFMGSQAGATFNPDGLRPLPPDQIGENINNLFRSSSKAYVSGWKPDSTFGQFATYDTSPATATLRASRLTLTSTKRLLVSLLALIIVITLLLLALVLVAEPEEFQLFGLGIIPVIAGDYKSSHLCTALHPRPSSR